MTLDRDIVLARLEAISKTVPAVNDPDALPVEQSLRRRLDAFAEDIRKELCDAEPEA